MAKPFQKENASKIRQRAAVVRSQWSPRERAERTGLPPDMPSRLRELLSEQPEPSWPPHGVFRLVESRLLPLNSTSETADFSYE